MTIQDIASLKKMIVSFIKKYNYNDPIYSKEDLIQEGYIALITNIDKYDPTIASLSTFVYYILWAHYSKLFKGCIRHPNIHIEYSEEHKMDMVAQLNAQRAINSIQEILDNSNDVVNNNFLKYVEGYSSTEISKQLNIPRSTSKFFIKRIKDEVIYDNI